MKYTGQTEFRIDEYNWRNWPQILVLLILILLNCAVGVAGLFYDDLWPDFSLIVEKVKDGEYYRLLTSMFIHADEVHLFLNMAALFGLGRILERVTGHIKFLIIYVCSGLCGGLMVMYIEEEGVMTGGASGAVFGLLGAMLVYMLVNGDYSMITSAFLMLVIEVSSTFLSEGISIGGHIGGLIGGLVFGMLLIRRKKTLEY